MNFDFMKEFSKYYDNFISDTVNLLQKPSVLTEYNPNNIEAPFGMDIRKCLDHFLNMAKGDGFKVKNVDNYAGYLEYGEGEDLLAILCHLDVVPAIGDWFYPPFSATIVDDKIYARGAMDDKGPAMAAYYALKMLKDEGIKLNKRVRLIVGYDEESGSRCLEHYLKVEENPTLGFSPDADFPLIYAEKGIASFAFKGIDSSDLKTFKAGVRLNMVPDLCEATFKSNHQKEFESFLKDNNYQGKYEDGIYKTFGKNAHGSMPELGLNAASIMAKFVLSVTDSKMAKFINDYLAFDHQGKKLNINTYDEEMKHLSLNPAIFNLEDSHFMVSSNIRYPRNFNYDIKMNELRELAKRLDLEFIELGNSKPLYVSKESKLVKTLYSSYQKYTGDVTPPMTIGGGTYAREIKNAVAFGPQFPGREESIHQPNEHAYIIDLVKAVFIYKDAIKNLCD